MLNFRKKFYNIVEYITTIHSKSIYQELCRHITNVYVMFQEKAARETFQYIEINMPLAQICLSPSEMLSFAINKVEIPGLFMEFGVYKGKSIRYIAAEAKKEVHGFDSFEGLPHDSEGFYWRKGIFTLKGTLPDVPKNVILHKGWFDKILPKFLNENKQDVAFLHMDPDLYSSHKIVFDLLKYRIKKGTIIVFDDYFDFPSWQSQGYKAFVDFVKENNVKYEYLAWRAGRMIGSENGGVCVRIQAVS